MTELPDIALLTLLMVLAIAIMAVRDLFETVMLFGIFSFLTAGLFVSMDAVDVAFTEAAVGAGVSTVLALSALAATTRTQRRSVHLRLLPVLLVAVTGAALVYGTFDMPRYGDPQAPVHHHVADRYLERSLPETGIPNVVTSVLASYRGFDTLGETVVIMTALVGVLLLLGRGRRGRPRSDPPPTHGSERSG